MRSVWEVSGPTSSRPRPRPDPGQIVLHPVFVGAVALLLLNDHLLKSWSPGLVTGKLSDFAGLIVLPLLVLALAQVCSWMVGLPAPSRRFLAVCVIAIGVMFTLGEIMPMADQAFERLWGIVRLPIGSLRHPDASSAVLVSDSTDVLALPALWIAWVVGCARCAVPIAGRLASAVGRKSLRQEAWGPAPPI